MEIKLQPGKYVVAVSGGVDSVALLDMLAQRSDLELVVAHFDHGIRSDSTEDAALVCSLAKQYGLQCKMERAELGMGASEAMAREARYQFLHRVQRQTEADAIVTAHHQDDVLETAIFNMLRGTGRRGLTSLQSTKQIKRPLIGVPKEEIKAYAVQRKLSWREDSTNRDERYARNYIRHRLLVKFDARARQQLLATIAKAQLVNDELDVLLNELLMKNMHGAALDRNWFIRLSHADAREVLAAWLRQQNLADFDRQTLERLTVQAKVKPVGKRLDVLHNHQITLTKQGLALAASKR
ncbi:MAG TPA: tRNA lysidine(34) synthetase TilS [Candidatus Saccharimonadales bacterium]